MSAASWATTLRGVSPFLIDTPMPSGCQPCAVVIDDVEKLQLFCGTGMASALPPRTVVIPAPARAAAVSVRAVRRAGLRMVGSSWWDAPGRACGGGGPGGGR